MGIFAWLIIGGIAGWLASMVMKTNSRQGTLIDIVVGIVGAFIGGFLLSALGLSSGDAITGFNLPSLATAFIGAVVLIGILKVVRK
ncbi:MAG: GlsB/YeaQ/YmgE family stress response membrane protein [Phototrophicaceae bacterium]